MDLSFMSNLKFLERLKFIRCNGFTSKHYEALSKKKFNLKELQLYSNYVELLPATGIIRSLCGETLLKLTLNAKFTLEVAKIVKKSCPRISSLHVELYPKQCFNSIIPLICKLSSLKILHMKGLINYDDIRLIVRNLSNHLTSVEDLSLDFCINLQDFEYFTNNCKAKLKKLNIFFNGNLNKDYLIQVSNFQKVHNSLEVLGINIDHNYETNFETEFSLLKNQGINVIFYND
jgi:hypothetical protein